MADASHKSAIDGEAIIDMTLNGKLYTGLTVGIVKTLFIDLILGKDFLKRHKQVTFQFNGSLAPLERFCLEVGCKLWKLILSQSSRTFLQGANLLRPNLDAIPTLMLHSFKVKPIACLQKASLSPASPPGGRKFL